jgi:hypothetical protein
MASAERYRLFLIRDTKDFRLGGGHDAVASVRIVQLAGQLEPGVLW